MGNRTKDRRPGGRGREKARKPSDVDVKRRNVREWKKRAKKC